MRPEVIFEMQLDLQKKDSNTCTDDQVKIQNAVSSVELTAQCRIRKDEKIRGRGAKSRKWTTFAIPIYQSINKTNKIKRSHK